MFDPSYDFLYCETWYGAREVIRFILGSHLPLTPYNPLVESPVLVERVNDGVEWTTAIFPLYHWLGTLKIFGNNKLTGELWFPDAPFRQYAATLNLSQQSLWVFPDNVKITAPEGTEPGAIKWLEKEELDDPFYQRHPGCERPLWSWEQRRAKIPPGESIVLNCEGWLLGGAELENCYFEDVTDRQKLLLDIAHLPELIQELIDSFELPAPQCLKSFVIEETWAIHQTRNFVDFRGLQASIVGYQVSNPIYTPLPEWWSYSCLVYATDFNMMDLGVEPFIDFSRTNYAGEYEPSLALWKLPREGNLQYSAPVNFPFQGHNFSLQGKSHPCQVGSLSQFIYNQGYGLIVDKDYSFYSQTEYGNLLAIDLDTSNPTKTGFDQNKIGYWANLWQNTFCYKLNPASVVGASMGWSLNFDLDYTFTPLFSSPPWWFYDDQTASLCQTLTLPVFWASCYLEGVRDNELFQYFDQKHVVTLALNNGANYNDVTLSDGFTSTEEALNLEDYGSRGYYSNTFEGGDRLNGVYPENDPYAYVEFKQKTFVGQCDRQFHGSRPTGIWGRDENGAVLSKAQVIAKLEAMLDAHDLRFDGEIVRIIPPPNTSNYNPTITAEGGKHYLFYCSGTLIYPSGVWDTVGAELVAHYNSNNQPNVLYFTFQNGNLGEEQTGAYFENPQYMRPFPQLFTYGETITLSITGDFEEADFSYIAKRFLRPYYNSEEGYFLCDRNFWMGNSRRIREIHAALKADRYGVHPTDPIAPNLNNLGYLIEAIGYLLGINLDADGRNIPYPDPEYLTPEQVKEIAHLKASQFAAFDGEKGMQVASLYDIRANVPVKDAFGKTVIQPGGAVKTWNLAQFLDQMADDTEAQLGGAALASLQVPAGDGKSYIQYEGLGHAIQDCLFMLSVESKRVDELVIQSARTIHLLQQVLMGLGLPMRPDTIDFLVGAETATAENPPKQAVAPVASLDPSGPTLASLAGIILANLSRLVAGSIGYQTTEISAAANTDDPFNFEEDPTPPGAVDL